MLEKMNEPDTDDSGPLIGFVPEKWVLKRINTLFQPK